jgi:hypothetical protein
MGRRYQDYQHVQRLDQGVLQASTSQAYFCFTSDQTFVSKGSFEMKRIIITFTTLMLATTSAFAQLSPDQMRAEMAKPDGHKMCPSNNEYSIIALRDACNHGRDSNSCGNGSDFDQACGKQWNDCYHRWVEGFWKKYLKSDMVSSIVF